MREDYFEIWIFLNVQLESTVFVGPYCVGGKRVSLSLSVGMGVTVAVKTQTDEFLLRFETFVLRI